MTTLLSQLAATPFASYTYTYPHKTAYRPFAAPIRLDALWAQEERDALFLYLHIPFCEMRCGFCNLFTTANPAAALTSAYLAALERQAEHVSRALGTATFARMAIGGGTPTFLDCAELARLFDIAQRWFPIALGAVPLSVETSPLTATPDRLRLLRERGVDRISIGVQSFHEAEARAAGRPQKTTDVHRALAAIRDAGFPQMNIDLIYGLPGQTVASWLTSLRAALDYAPEELFLYPLYVRPLTGLGRHGKVDDDDVRLACYRAGRALLLAAGYTQESLRMFRAPQAAAATGPVYCAQDDGMVGLGCGARSYTSACHYSSEYAVGVSGVRAIIADYIAQPAASFGNASFGIMLDGEEQRRRYVMKSLLEAGGIDCAAYQQRFGTEVMDDLPSLQELYAEDLATTVENNLRLTPRGIELSDAIGPWLYSAPVRELMGGYSLR